MQLSAFHGSLQNALRVRNDLRKFLQRTSTPEYLRIVDHRLDAKYALAFGINLQSQLAAVQLEDRQIIRRSLDRDFPFSRFLFPLAIFRTALVAQYCFDCFQVQQHAAAVNQRLKGLGPYARRFRKSGCDSELHLVVRVLVMKPAPLLLLQVERET